MLDQPRFGDDPSCQHCEAFLVRSWRLIMARGVECPIVTHQFKCICGIHQTAVFDAFCTFLCALALSQRRCLIVNPPGEATCTADERRMLALIAAAQNKRPSLLNAHLSWLSRSNLRQTLEQSVHELASALGSSGLRIMAPA